MIDFEQLKAESKGRWPVIYHQLGIDVGEGKHQPCPLCGGVDRFRFDDKHGTGNYICGQCGAGNGISLVMKYFNIDFPETLRKIQSIIGDCEKVETRKPKKNPKIALNKLWSSSKSLTGSDPVSKYLHSRGLTLTPDNVRYCEKCYHKELGLKTPALIARIQAREGRPVSLHRIYLLPDIKPKKKIMPATESLLGCAVRLFGLDNEFLDSEAIGVAEGVETAMSCVQLFQIPTWAAITTSIMESWTPPEDVKRIIIFADNDANYAGQKSAYILANKLYLKDLIVSVEIPDKAGTDFNDVLNEKV